MGATIVMQTGLAVTADAGTEKATENSLSFFAGESFREAK
jgi:hypothetical protein